MLVVLNSQDAVDAFASTAQLSLGTELSLALGPLGRSAETNMTAGDNGAPKRRGYPSRPRCHACPPGLGGV